MPAVRPQRYVFALTMVACFAAHGAPTPAQPNWTVEQALQASAQINTVQMLAPLFALARESRSSELLEELRALSTDETLPLPAREQVLQAFAVGLGDLQPDAVGTGVLSFLLDYRPRVLVPHEEQSHLGVPLYNVAAAAVGVANDWARQVAANRAAQLLQEDASVWITAYLAAGVAQRRGFQDSLELSEGEPLRELAGHALDALPGEPGLTAVVARCALLLSDIQLLHGALRAGSGPDIAPALRAAAVTLDDPDLAAVLRDAVHFAPAANAALALAELAPGLLQQPGIESLLFDLLGDANLGATAALTLSRSRDPDILDKLAQLAGRDEGLLSRRAAMASDLAAQNRGGSER